MCCLEFLDVGRGGNLSAGEFQSTALRRPGQQAICSAQRYRDLYADVPLELAPSATEGAHAALPRLLRDSEAAYRWQARAGTPADREESIKNYYRLVAGIDEVVGSIRKKLEEKGLGDNTVIIFTSDNGFFLGEHGLSGKWFMHEPSIRVPMIVFDPRLEPAQAAARRDDIVLNLDVAPTGSPTRATCRAAV